MQRAAQFLRTIPFLVFLLFLPSLSLPQVGVAERIRRIESGLVVAEAQDQPVSTLLADRMVSHKVPGVSIAVINNYGIEWARGYGVVEVGIANPVTPDTLFQASSISKPVAAVAALRLVQDGKLGLDEDVNSKLRSWQIPDNEFTAQKKVTLRGLLSHSAGVTVHGFRGYAPDGEVPTLLDVLEGKAAANSAPIRVDILPGSQWRYSGGGYCISQQLLIDTTGRTFHQLLRETVLHPLRMIDSSYEQPLPEALQRHAATGHRKGGEIVKGKWHIYPEMAAAGLWTTPSDLARFAIELMLSEKGRSNQILSQQMAKQMLTHQLGGYGLGIMVEGERRDKSFRFSHGGSNEGFRCHLLAFPELGQGVVIMTNSDNGRLLIDELLRSVANEYGWASFLR